MLSLFYFFIGKAPAKLYRFSPPAPLRSGGVLLR